MFDGEGDVVLYRGYGYKVSGMNTHGIPMVLQKPNYFFPYPAVILNATEEILFYHLIALDSMSNFRMG